MTFLGPLLFPVLLLIILGMPIAWLVAEYKARTAIRLLLGVTTICCSFAVAAIFMLFARVILPAK